MNIKETCIFIIAYFSWKLLSPVLGNPLACLNYTNNIMWQEACSLQGRYGRVDKLCKEFRKRTKSYQECSMTMATFGFSVDSSADNNPVEKNLPHGYLYHKTLRRDVCSSIAGMSSYVYVHLCTMRYLQDCLDYDAYYSVFTDMLPPMSETFDFIYSFCRAGPPFEESVTINDECILKSTQFCWEEVMIRASPNVNKTFCEMIMPSYECHKRFMTNDVCQAASSATLELIRAMHLRQTKLLCRKEFVFHEGLHLPVGMVRYYLAGFIKDRSFIS